MMATTNELGTKFNCPCGDRVNLTMTVGTPTREGEKTILPLSFDKDQFVEDFSAHVLADPENEQHAPFVVAVDG